MADWPTHCSGCGALLEGGATVHAEGCWVRKLIAEFFEIAAQSGTKPPPDTPPDTGSNGS